MNLHIQAPYNSLGYGIAAKNILKALDRNGHDVTYWPIGNPQPETQDEVPLLKTMIERQEFYNSTAPSVKIWHQHDLASHIGRGINVGFPFFELNKFTPRETWHLNAQDIVLVSSKWAKEIVEQETITGNTVRVVPLGVDRSVFYDKIEKDLDGPTVFLNIGKWEIRKGHDILVDIFNTAFEPEDNVELWLMPDNPFLTKEQTASWVRRYKESKMGDKIRILPRQVTQQEVANLMRGADCGIFPARAEGWNLEALEMMSCGKMVIATKYSAHTEFMNQENALLVSVSELEDAYDGVWFHGQGQWASFDMPQFEAFVDYMKYFHELKTKHENIDNIPGIETAKKFSWDNSAIKLVEALI